MIYIYIYIERERERERNASLRYLRNLWECMKYLLKTESSGDPSEESSVGYQLGKHLRASVESLMCSSEVQKDRMTEWLSDSVTNWENDRKTKMSEWQWHRATEWHSDRVTDWQNGKRVGWWDGERVERVCEWVGMGGWVAGKMVMLVLPPNWHPRSPDFQHRTTFFRTQNIKLK